MKTGRIIKQNIKHMKHTPVTAKQQLRDQIAKNRTQTLVTFLSTDPTKCDSSYIPHTAHTHVHEPRLKYET